MAERGVDPLAHLSAAKRALYERRLAEKRAAAQHADAAVDVGDQLSRAQQRYWFLERLEPGNPAHHISGATRLRGVLDVRALEGALGELARRHEILRTRFVARDGEARQRVAAWEPIALPVIDLATFAPARREPERARALERLTQAPFDLEYGAPWRCVLLRHGEREHELATCFHHIAADGVSIAIVYRELVECYAARVKARAPHLAALPWQVRDHASWQHDCLASGRWNASLRHWQRELAELPQLELPTDKPRSRDWSVRTRPVEHELDAGLVQRARELARANGATLHMLLLAAFGAWLARWSGQAELPIGVPVAGRSRDEMRALVGFFVNSVVVRVDTRGARTFVELLERVKRASVAALEHSDLPFEHVVEALAPERHLDRNPLFQVMFNLIDFVDLRARAAGLEFEAVPLQSGTQLDLALDAWVRDGLLRLELETDPGLFDAATGPRLLAEFARFLAAVIAAPRAELAQLDCADVEEARQVREWGERAAGPDAELDPLSMFHARVEHDGTRIALHDGARTFDYRECGALVARLSAALAARGVSAGDVVAVRLPRCVERVLLPLALWRLDAVYAPLDLGWPELRAQRILARIDARCVVDAAALELFGVHDAGATAERGRVALDERYAVRDPGARGNASDPQRPAALFFTSGSTGEPKGVLLPRRAFANHAAWVRAQFDLTCEDRVLHWTSPGFDASLWETLPALTSGAAVVLAPHDAERDPRLLAHAVRHAAITHVQLVPALLGDWLAALDDRRPLALRHVISGGEALTGELAREFRETFERARTDAALWNLYGPTETCIDATFRRVIRADERRACVPLGAPIAGARVRIVDREGRVLGIGRVGEIEIGGAGLALSYWRDATEDARRFAGDDADARVRWYRSGDRGRWRDDGVLEFLGRHDEQLKLRGQRIELGEIEAALASHPAVLHCVVAPRGPARDEQLVAWLELRDSAILDEASLRAWARRRVPESWVPARFAAVASWPLNANGKIDRRALREPDVCDEPAHPDRVARGDEGAALVAAQMALVLERASVPLDVDFFALGGHSLLAARLAARLETALGGVVPLREVFAFPTARALARRLADTGEERSAAQQRLAARAGEAQSDASRTRALAGPGRARGGALAQLDPIRPREDTSKLHASPGEERLWLLQMLQPASTAYLMAGALVVRGELDERALSAALRQCVEAHEALRTRYPAERARPRPELVACAPNVLEVRACDDRAAAFEWVRTHLCRPFDLARETPLRVGLARCDENERVLGFVLHHIAGDGVSLNVLQRELAQRYACERARREPCVAAPVLRPSDRALWLKTYESSERGREDLAAWREVLEGAPTVLELPTDSPRGADRERPARRLDFRLSAELARAIDARAVELGATPNMVLCSAWAIVLARWAGVREVVIGGAFAGRQRQELETLVAFCVSLLPLRIALPESATFAQCVERAREAVLDALSREHVSFDRLVDVVGVTRDATRPPLVQVSFAWHAEPLPPLELEGTTSEIVDLAPAHAKLELSLEVEKRVDGLACRLEWDASLWSEDSMRVLADAWTALVRAAIEDPQREYDELPLLDERARVADAAWSRASARVKSAGRAERATPEPERSASDPRASDRRAPRSFVEQWLARARTRPEREALVDGDVRIRHGELVETSARIATVLRKRGVVAEQTVGLLLARSWRSVSALVSVWRAAGAAVPLDPEQPLARSAALLRDAGAALVVIDDDVAEPRDLPCACVRWSELVTAAARVARAEPEDRASARQLAYVIYTSGSTGVPKGVEVEHGALATHLDWMQREMAEGVEGRVLHRLAPAFDAALFETACVLAAGGTCIAVPRAIDADPRALGALAERERATLVVTLPAFFERIVADDVALPRFRGVREWICGGEALATRAARAWRRAAQRFELSTRLWNLYGPTEATVHCTAHRVDGRETGASVPIGLPITDTEAWVLDERGAQRPRGWPGELWLGGPNLARGYRGRDAETARAFVTHAGTRLYRSGDVVRRDANGELVYQARRDGQIKLRGRRIELGEIEAQLAAHRDVVEAVCLYVVEPEPHVVAHVLAAPDRAVDEAELRAWLAERVPSALVPLRIAVHARLPRLASGKVDRAPLAQWRWEALRASSEPPSGPVESAIARVFARLLARETVGRDDSFFALGGSSLSALEAFECLCRELGREIELRALFEDPTPRALAARLAHARAPDARELDVHELGAAVRAPRPDLEAHARLDRAWAPARGEPRRGRDVEHVLITGATGFLGVFVLDELARNTNARLHCLVRASDAEAGARRLRAALAAYSSATQSLARDELLDRVHVVPGDLAAPDLGLDARERERLERDVDLVLHVGARVHFVARYAELEAENVASTRALLELCAHGRAKAFHFVSTLGVVAARGIGPLEHVSEDDPLERFLELDDGYEQTKWVCERLLQHAARRGLEVAIHRPGRISAHGMTGACNRTDAASAFLRGCAELGLVPRLRGELDLTPVDYVARAIVALALRGEPSAADPNGARDAAVWHLLNPRSTPLSLAVSAFADVGRDVREAGIAEWRTALRARLAVAAEHPLRAFAPVFLENRAGARDEESVLPDLALPRVASERTRAALAALGVACPTVDAEWMRRWLSWAIDGPTARVHE